MKNMRNNFTNINVPKIPKSIAGRESIYPFVLMSPGDYSKLEFESNHKTQIARRCAHVTSRKRGYKYITKITGFTLEVWCIDKNTVKPT